jgi:hypothetical protein
MTALEHVFQHFGERRRTSTRALRQANTREPVWIGEAKRSGGGTDLRKVVASFLVPSVDILGRNAPKASIVLSATDARVGALNGP